jgi:hypothetical protein
MKAADLRRGQRIVFEGREEIVVDVNDWSDSTFPDTARMVGLVLARDRGSVERAVDRDAEIEIMGQDSAPDVGSLASLIQRGVSLTLPNGTRVRALGRKLGKQRVEIEGLNGERLRQAVDSYWNRAEDIARMALRWDQGEPTERDLRLCEAQAEAGR